MPKLPKLSGDKTIKILSKFGFVFSRQKGSHIIFKKENKIRRNRMRSPQTQGVSRWYFKRNIETS